MSHTTKSAVIGLASAVLLGAASLTAHLVSPMPLCSDLELSQWAADYDRAVMAGELPPVPKCRGLR